MRRARTAALAEVGLCLGAGCAGANAIATRCDNENNSHEYQEISSLVKGKPGPGKKSLHFYVNRGLPEKN
jgi:hypothetical protein